MIVFTALLTGALTALFTPVVFAANSCPRAAVSERVDGGKVNVLFSQDGRIPKDYPAVLDGIQPGDQIKLPDNSRFIIKAPLAKGAMSRIFELADGWLLRVPNSWAPWKYNWSPHLKVNGDMNFEYFGAMHSFMETAPIYKKDGIRTIEIDVKRSRPPYGIVVKKENFLFTGDQFLYPHLKLKISKEVREQAEDALIEFVAKTWRYKTMHDFTSRQIGFNGKEWIMFDVGGPAGAMIGRDLAMNFKENDHVLTNMGDKEYLSPTLKKRLEERILIEREKMQKTGKFFERDSYDGTLIYGVTEVKIAKGSEFVLPYELQGSLAKEFSERVNERREAQQPPTGALKVLTEAEAFARDAKIREGEKAPFRQVEKDWEIREYVTVGDFVKSEDGLLIYKAQVGKKKATLTVRQGYSKGEKKSLEKRIASASGDFLSGSDYLLQF